MMGKAVYLLSEGLILGLHHSWLITKLPTWPPLPQTSLCISVPSLFTMALHCSPPLLFPERSVLQAQHKRLVTTQPLHDRVWQTSFLKGFKHTEILQEHLCLFIQIYHFLNLFFPFSLYVCVIEGVVTCDGTHVKVREQLVRAGFSLSQCGPENQTQIIMPNGRHLNLNHLIGRKPFIY